MNSISANNVNFTINNSVPSDTTLNITGSKIHNLYLNGVRSNSNWDYDNSINVITIGSVRNVEVDFTGPFVQSLSENVGLTDSISTVAQHAISLSESLATTDSLKETAVHYISLSESVSLLDSIIEHVNRVVSLQENTIITDSFMDSVIHHVSLSENVNLSDSMNEQVNRLVLLYESLLATDTMTTQSIHLIQLIENVVLSDSMLSQIGHNISLSESIGLTDSILNSLSHSVFLTESVSVLDILTNQYHAASNGYIGGGSSYSPPVVVKPVIPVPVPVPTTVTTTVSALPATYSLVPGATSNVEHLDVNWNIPANIEVDNVTVPASSPITIVFQKGPIVLQGSPTGASSAGIVFGYLVPPNYCNPGQIGNCVDPVSYNVPITVQGVLGNGTHFSTTTNLTFNFVPRNDYIYLFMVVVIGIIISGVSYRIIFRKKNKKNDYDEEGNKKPKKGKRVEDLMKERRSRNAAREGTLMKRLQDLD